jgi:thioesterase domain-containing protein
MNLSSLRDSLDVLLPIRTQGTRPPFFLMHPGGGLSWSYMPLARYAEDVPLYGLQARGVDGRERLAASIEEMAADYVEQIRSVQPAGPYHLIGWSFGGIPVQEVAVQLRNAGEEVGALVIMDTFPTPEELRKNPVPEPEGVPDYLMDRVRQEAGQILGGVSDEELRSLVRVFVNNVGLKNRHTPNRFNGDALLLIAGETRGEDAPTVELWQPHISGTISEVRLPCRHSDMVQPQMLERVWSAVSTWLGWSD